MGVIIHWQTEFTLVFPPLLKVLDDPAQDEIIQRQEKCQKISIPELFSAQDHIIKIRANTHGVLTIC